MSIIKFPSQMFVEVDKSMHKFYIAYENLTYEKFSCSSYLKWVIKQSN